MISLCTVIEDARQGRGEDRVAVIDFPDRKVIVVVDGAGGVARGAEAANFICRALEELRGNDTPALWSTWLCQLDRSMATSGSYGLAAVVVLEVRDDGAISGASVGDCEAWIFGEAEPTSLTARQIRKPLLGGGDAIPVDFAAQLSGGTLIAGSDGLWKYTSHQRIVEAATVSPLQAAATALVDSVRLRSGTLQDDVAVVVCDMEK